ncbi:MAG: bifunctional riboflavin kinase/FAD synthetase [Cryomorphaceae bacterium]|nr:MAG: bifunctional riboflavin kinase/FAD synthetase [Cryomorphaceae bacterium]
MKVYQSIDSFAPLAHAVVTPGTFDGVHLGHKTILNRLTEIAAKHKGQSVVLTFHPHPRIVLHGPDTNIRLLTTLEEKTDLLAEAGIDHFIIHPFTPEFSRTSVVHYVRDLLVSQIGMKHMVIGYDHHFGRNREGSLENLQELAPLYDFDIEEIPAQDIDRVNVSSTKIRHALNEGDVERAARYLGYHYRLTASVVTGQQLGRQIGFPTANLELDNPWKMIPAHGVYAVEVTVNGTHHAGMLNIGMRPTIAGSDKTTTLEVHLLDFKGDLYGQQLGIGFVARLRNETRFNSMEQLKEQLIADRERVRETLQRR